MRKRRSSPYLVLTQTLWLLASLLVAKAQPIQLLHPTNTVWRYLAPLTDPGFGTDWKEPGFEDAGSPWQSGVGLFGHEPGGLGTVYEDLWRFNTAIAPPSQGTPNGPINAFFRTRFVWSGDTQNVVLLFTNYVDDGMAIFLNGIEIHRFLLNGNPGDPVEFQGTPQTGRSFSEPVRNVVAFNVANLPGGILRNGENSVAVYVGQNSQTSEDVVFGMSLHAGPCIPPVVVSPLPSGTNITIAECGSASLMVEGAPISPLAYQWFHSGVAVGSGTNAWLTITNARPGVHGGAYTVRVTNLCGSVTSAPIHVVVASDVTPPRLLFAEVNSTRTQIRTTWSEPLAAPDPQSPFSFSVRDNAGAEVNSFVLPALQNETNLLIEITPDAWMPGRTYYIHDLGGGARDRCKGLSSAESTTRVREPLFFRDGLSGYTGTRDADLRGAAPDTPFDAPILRIDNQDGSPSAPCHGLLRFDGLFAHGQILCGASIELAILRLTVTDPGSPVRLHRMLVNWDEATATWNSFVDGITNDNLEAEELAVATLSANEIEIDVTRSVREWANGATNVGWALLPSGSDRVEVSSSENTMETSRPELRVFWIHADPCFITAQPPAVITIGTGETLAMSVALACNGASFRWQKHSSGLFADIPGATNATYSKSSVATADSGNYRVIVETPCINFASTVTAVTVKPRSVMSIELGPDATIVSWDPANGVLEESIDLVTWTASENQASGTSRPLATGRFFRVRQ